MLGVLFEQWLQVGGKWDQSSLVAQARQSFRGTKTGARRWMQRSDLIQKYQDPVIADEIIASKEGDPLVRACCVRPNPDLPSRADLKQYLCWDASHECDVEDTLIEQMMTVTQSDLHKRAGHKNDDHEKPKKKRRRVSSSSSSSSVSSVVDSSDDENSSSSSSKKAKKNKKKKGQQKKRKGSRNKKNGQGGQCKPGRGDTKREQVSDDDMTEAKKAKLERDRKKAEEKAEKERLKEEEKAEKERQKEEEKAAKERLKEAEKEKKRKEREEKQQKEKELGARRSKGKKALHGTLKM